ncbi:MAG: universal stress protein [Roseiflexaceae bacterium]
MKTILVPLDGSTLARQALPYAQALARALKARIQLLRVIPDLERESLVAESMLTMYVGEIAASYEERDRQVLRDLTEHAEGYLAGVVEPLLQAGLDVTTLVRVGPPAELIVEVAAANEALAIVMATHGYSGIQRWALGSVADKVVHATSVPVLLVRGKDGEEPGPEPTIKQIMVPYDGSALSGTVLPCAANVARATNAKMVLLHAVDPLAEGYPTSRAFGYSLAHPDRLLHELVADVDRQLEHLAAETANGDLIITPMTLIGYPAEVIVDEAERRHVDLIVMATHGYSGLRRWALGSVADKVLHTTTTPLLLVRAKE